MPARPVPAQDGVSPIRIAAERGHAKAIRALIEAKADPDAKDNVCPSSNPPLICLIVGIFERSVCTSVFVCSLAFSKASTPKHCIGTIKLEHSRVRVHPSRLSLAVLLLVPS